MPSLIQKRSYGSVKVFWLDRDGAIAALKDRAEKLIRERPEVQSVILFGSLAEGRATPGSDADILILLRSSTERFLDRYLTYQPYFDGIGLPVEIFCYTDQELPNNSLARKAGEYGLALAGDG